MTQTTTISTHATAEATLFLPPAQRAVLAGLLADIDRALVADEAGFRRITAREDEFTLLERDGRRVLVALCPEPVATEGLSSPGADSATATRLRNHAACLSVSVRPRPGSEMRDRADDPAAQKVCEEVVARVLPLAGPDLLHWASTGQLQHVEDFAETRRIAQARRPNTRTPRPSMSLLSSAGLPSDVLVHPVSRIAQAPVSVPRPRRPSELRASPVPPAVELATSATPIPDEARARGRAQADAVFPPFGPRRRRWKQVGPRTDPLRDLWRRQPAIRRPRRPLSPKTVGLCPEHEPSCSCGAYRRGGSGGERHLRGKHATYLACHGAYGRICGDGPAGTGTVLAHSAALRSSRLRARGAT
jgi:hypothetical protein